MIRNKVAQFFDANDITIPKAHHASGISRSSLTRLYRNEVININMDTIDAICTAFDCKFEDLFEFVPEEKMTREDVVQVTERKLHVEYYTKLRRKGAKKTGDSD